MAEFIPATAFEGYVAAKLEANEDDHKEMKRRLKRLEGGGSGNPGPKTKNGVWIPASVIAGVVAAVVAAISQSVPW